MTSLLGGGKTHLFTDKHVRTFNNKTEKPELAAGVTSNQFSITNNQ